MPGRARALGIATAVAVATTVGIAALVGAEPAPDLGAAAPVVPTGVAATTAGVTEAPHATLPAVTTHDLDPATVAASASKPAHHGGQSVTEIIQLTIIGGDLQLVTDHASVILERVPGTRGDWAGTLPPVRVIDATGSGAGWEVRWVLSSLTVQTASTPSHVADAEVRLEPGAPVVVAGLPEGIAAGNGGSPAPQGRTLFAAEPGAGGGTYEAGGTVSLHLPRRIDATRVVVDLAFSLG